MASNDKKVRQKYYELRRRSREQHLELMGVDVKALRKLEKEVESQFEDLIGQVRETLKKAGEETAKLHEASLEKAKGLIRKETQMALGIPGKVAELAHFDRLTPRLWCQCLYLSTASAEGEGNDPAVINPPSGGTGNATVNFEAAGNVAHPLVEARGQGTGTINSAQLTTWFKFAFTPSTDATYCIHPHVYMSGHWLLWTWGSCGGSADDLGSGTVRVKLRIQVDQLSLPVKSTEHLVLEQTASGGHDFHSGFAYDSTVDGGAATSVYLEGGHEAVIWVKCDCFAEIVNHGRAWVDLQTSPSFYYKVPETWWGWVWCLPWSWWKVVQP